MIVATVYFAIPHRLRWFWLLAASCYFYMALVPAYILVLFLLITIDYLAGIFIENTEGHARKICLMVSIVSTCAVLFFLMNKQNSTGLRLPVDEWQCVLSLGRQASPAFGEACRIN
jgi:hypothetical protein